MPRAFNSLSPRTKFAKRHYEAIAQAMQHAHVPQGIICDPAKRNQWESVCNELADMFARDNGMFKRDVSQGRMSARGAMGGHANGQLQTYWRNGDQCPREVRSAS
jgi:hypothetical protein